MNDATIEHSRDDADAVTDDDRAGCLFYTSCSYVNRLSFFFPALGFRTSVFSLVNVHEFMNMAREANVLQDPAIRFPVH